MEDTMSMTQKRVMPNDLRDFCGAAMAKCGLTPPDAALRDGMRLPDYVIVNLLGLAEDVGMLPELEAIFR